jgi:predicted nucleotidyltransferase
LLRRASRLVGNQLSQYGFGVVSDSVIQSAARTLVAAARQPARVLLFGSHARGDAGPDSDLDFLVIERDLPDRHAEMVRLSRELRQLGVPVDVVVVSEAYAEEWGAVQGTVVHEALREGREFDVAA